MERGLNARLNTGGWDAMEPHQVWFPCMGCKGSYCNKCDLCLITRAFRPDSCYKLPEDLGRLQVQMGQAGDAGHRIWVLKQDVSRCPTPTRSSST